MRVAVILPSFDIGGTENMVANLAKYINKDKFELLVISLREPMNTHVQKMIEDSGVQIGYAYKGKVNAGKVFLNVYKMLSKFKPDLIHSNMYAFAYATPYLMLNDVKMLHTIHNKPINEFKDKYKKVIAYLYKKNKAIPVAISHIVEREMHEIYTLNTIERVYNPVETEKFKTKRQLTKNTDITFINVARMMKQKNQSLLLKAFRVVCNTIPGVQLQFVGDGELHSELLEEAEKLNVINNVSFVGNVSNVNEYLAKADVFVLSSDYEGLPLSVLEAMAAGLPIISTNVGGVADIVTNNGFLVEPGNADALASKMIELAQNVDLRYEMSCKSAQNAEPFDSREFIRQYEALYVKYGKKRGGN